MLHTDYPLPFTSCRLRLKPPLQGSADVSGNFERLGIRRGRGVKGIVVALAVVGPIVFGNANLQVDALPRRQRAGRLFEADFRIMIGSGNRLRQFNEAAGHVRAADLGPIAEEILPLFPVDRIVITQSHILERKRLRPGVGQLDTRIQRIGRGLQRPVVSLDPDTARWRRCGIYNRDAEQRIGPGAGSGRSGASYPIGCSAKNPRRIVTCEPDMV